MDIESYLVSVPGLCVGIWLLAYTADYCLTIWGARLYAQGARDHVLFEGSYELTPGLVADVDALRLFSPRFVGWLVAISLVMTWAWLTWLPGGRQPFLFCYGLMVFIELAIATRHATNINLFRRLSVHQGADGQVRYARWLSLEMSSVTLSALAALLLVAALIAWKATLFGGACGVFVVGLSHARMSRQLRAQGQTAADPVQPAEQSPVE